MREKNKYIVVFDLDNTLIKGHIIADILQVLLKQYPKYALPFIRTLFTTAATCSGLVASAIQDTLHTGNYSNLDYVLQLVLTRFYNHINHLLNLIGLTWDHVTTLVAPIIHTPSFVNHRFVRASCNALLAYLKRYDTRVVIASASPQNIVIAVVRSLLHLKNVRAVNKILFVGTRFDQVPLIACVGSSKVTSIYDELENHTLYLQINAVYTDNGFLADLPLLRACGGQRFIIGNYSGLQKKMLDCFPDLLSIFLPYI